MAPKRRLAPIALILAVAVPVPGQATATEGAPHYLIAPGQTKVFRCGWGYGPIARQSALHAADEPLRLRRVTRPRPTGTRVVFNHKVTVREELGQYRTIFNRGNQLIDYRDHCPGRSADY